MFHPAFPFFLLDVHGSWVGEAFLLHAYQKPLSAQQHQSSLFICFSLALILSKVWLTCSLSLRFGSPLRQWEEEKSSDLKACLSALEDFHSHIFYCWIVLPFLNFDGLHCKFISVCTWQVSPDCSKEADRKTMAACRIDGN
ncbi:hypothetical protein QUC31_006523 [Theobroma cacao]